MHWLPAGGEPQDAWTARRGAGSTPASKQDLEGAKHASPDRDFPMASTLSPSCIGED